MTDIAADSPPKYFSARAIPLLKEYSEKLASMTAEAQRLIDARRRGEPQTVAYELRDRIASLKPAAASLARHVSQRLEHGNLDEMDKLELSLRLAEFEHALLAAERAVVAAQK